MSVIIEAAQVFEPRYELNWFFDPLPVGAFGLVMLDPPWCWTSYSDKGLTKAPQAHYDTMDLAAIKAMPVDALAHPDGMWVWLWATAPMYDAARACFDAWGVTFSTMGVWVKSTVDGKGLAFGTGHVLRNCHEPFLIGRIGKPRVCSKRIRSVIMAPRGRHSEKPDAAYAAAEELFGDVRRADVFSRRTRTGWESWGREAGKFDPAVTVAA